MIKLANSRQRYGRPLTVSQQRARGKLNYATWGEFSSDTEPRTQPEALDSLLDVAYKPSPKMNQQDIDWEFAVLCHHAGAELRALEKATGSKRAALDVYLSGGVVGKAAKCGT